MSEEKVLTISDGGDRVLLSSIAAYKTCFIDHATVRHDSGIAITLKSGSSVTLDFSRQFLRDKAVDWLDDQMAVMHFEYKPCPYCEYEGDEDACDYCYENRGYDRFRRKEVTDGEGD